jgi:two-component system, NarL family, sensor histidine kinase UhpB
MVGDMRRFRSLSVFWRVLLIDAAVLAVAFAALAAGPITVSYPVRAGQLLVLGGGLILMLAVTTVLLQRTLRPLESLTQTMRAIDPLAPGRRVDVGEAGADVTDLARAFNAMLDRLEQERIESGRRALSVQESERRRVARELHDEVGQTLTAMLLQVEGLATAVPASAQAELDELRETARTGAEEVRRIAQRLRPEALEELGLQAAMLTLLDGVKAQAHISTRHTIERDLPLNAEDELVVYRVAQEALTNVVRHAKATSVSLSLTAVDGTVVLRVGDDGRGIEPELLDSSYGIRGMRERALLIGATIDVRSRPGAGTTVELVVP